MRHTLKAVFDHRSDAQHVLDALLAYGYPSTNMALSRAPPTTRADRGIMATSADHAESLGASVKRTLKRLFHPHDTQTIDHFRRFVRGGHVVTLTTGSGLESKSATNIIERFGPASIEDLQDEPNHDSATMPAGAPASSGVAPSQSQPMSYRSSTADDGSMESPRVGTMDSIYPPGTAPGALQNRAHEDSHYFGMQSASSPPTGDTFQETMGAATQWESIDDDRREDARSSPDSNSRDNDREAYRYGAEMRISDKYRNCSWDEVERCLKSNWEGRETNGSTWDQSINAIRCGWNSTSPDIDDDSYYRSHWNATYRDSTGKPGYDDRLPAYLYGSEAGRSEKYRSHDWRDVEPDIEADWKARHPGQLSPWCVFKDAVKHGWNRVSLDMDGKDAAIRLQRPSGTAGGSIEDNDHAATNRPGSGSVERKSS